MISNLVETDVLVVGGGGAGSIAAVEARRLGADVFVVSKEGIGLGDTRASGSLIAAAFGHVDPLDNPDEHFKDTVKAGEFLSNQLLVRILVEEARQTVLQLERYGIIFERMPEKPDKYKAIRMGGHNYSRSIRTPPGEGLELVREMKNAILRYGVSFLEGVMITKLLKSDGDISGAVGVNIFNGEFYVFRAKSLVLATGGVGGLYYPHTTNTPTNTGDGHAIAYRVGAELTDMEMMQFIPYGVTHPDYAVGINFGEPSLAGPHGKLLNAIGERIMPKYDPELKEMSTRARVSRAIVQEVYEGRGTKYGGCLLDLQDNKKHPDGLKHLENVMAGTKHGVLKDLYGTAAWAFDEPWDVYPTQHYIPGGIRTNEWCETCIPGLYAAGQIQGGVHGADRLGSNSLCQCFVFGRRAGIAAAERAQKMPLPRINATEADHEYKRIYEILERKPKEAVSVIDLAKKVQKAMWDNVGVIRDEQGLTSALKKFEKIRTLLNKIELRTKSTRYNLEWFKALELPNMLDVAEMCTRSALVRTETRGGHFRRDYPDKNDEKWLRNIVVKLKREGKMSVSTEPVTF